MNNNTDPNTPTNACQTEAVASPPATLLLTNGEHLAEPVTEANAATPPTVTFADEADMVAPETNAPVSDAVNTAEVTPGVNAPAPTATRRKRRTDASRNDLWPRHHAISMLALIGALLAVSKREAATILLQLCSFTLKPGFLNLDNSCGVADEGLREYYFKWAHNRIFYFDRGEHPSKRRRLGAVYEEFCRQFRQNVESRIPISEQQARTFWRSVANRVPFHSPTPFEDKADANSACGQNASGQTAALVPMGDSQEVQAPITREEVAP